MTSQIRLIDILRIFKEHAAVIIIQTVGYPGVVNFDQCIGKVNPFCLRNRNNQPLIDFANIKNGRNCVTTSRDIIEDSLRYMVFLCQIVDEFFHILVVIDVCQLQQMMNLGNSKSVYDYTPMVLCLPPNRFNQRTDKEKIIFPTAFTSGHRVTSLLSKKVKQDNALGVQNVI